MSEPVQVHREDSGGLVRTLKDLFAGAAGGVAQVLLGQPFDIVKVRLQTATTVPPPTALQTFLHIQRHEGPLAFYKGTLVPLLGIGACVSVQFGAFHEARRRITQWNTQNRPGRTDLTYPQYYLAGATAGIANTVLSSPIEHVRIRLQTQPHEASKRLYHGPGDCVRQLLKAGKLYMGTSVTLLREAQAYGVWFLTFEYLMNRSAKVNRVERKDIPSWKVALFGGIAGEMLWLASYPFDVIKSRMQSDMIVDGRYRGMRDCFRQTWREGGVGAFWKGIGPTLLRAMPVSAGTFFVVEMTMRIIG